MINRFNDWVAAKLSDILGNMWLFWLIIALDGYYIKVNPPHKFFDGMLLAFSIILQSVALVIINNTTIKEGKETRQLLTETHDAVMEEVADLKKITAQLDGGEK